MFRLDKSEKGQSLHLQLVKHFRDMILSGELAPGLRLPTELDLAHEHGISRNTVRQAMSTLVNEGLLERHQGRGTFVREWLGQRGERQQREQRDTQGLRVGVVLCHSGDQLNMEILIGIEQATKTHGCQVTFAYAEESPAQQARDIDRLLRDRVAGLIIFPLSDEENDPIIAQAQASGTPLVLVDRYLPQLATDYVGADNYTGGYRATEHLLILGHTRIGFLHATVGSLLTTSVRHRWEGYRAALRDHGLPYDEALVCASLRGTPAAADDPYVALLSRPDRPTAAFVVTDTHVPKVLQAARQCGLRVPEDLALVGFDDLIFAAHMSPPLTTVAQPRVDIGLRAGHLLLSRIAGNTGPAQRIELPTSLIVRESCGARLRIQQSVERRAAAGGA